MKETKTLQPYNFRELPLEMKEKAEKMIADISPLGEVNEGTVDAVEAWSREDVLVLMRAMYNEALRQPRPIPSDDQAAAEKYGREKFLECQEYGSCGKSELAEAYAAGMLAERERLMKDVVLIEATEDEYNTIRDVLNSSGDDYGKLLIVKEVGK